MADFVHNNLLHSLSSPRFPLFSFPLTLSPHSSFSTVRFISHKFTKPSHFQFLAKSSQLDIVSTTEISDGSVVFKFGDASEVCKSVENVENFEIKGRLIDEFDDNVKKLEVVSSLDGEVVVKDTKSVIVAISEGEIDHNAVTEGIVTAGGEEIREVVEILDGANNARIEKPEVERSSHGEHCDRDGEYEVVGPNCGENDVCDTKVDIVVNSDVELDVGDVKEVVESVCDEFEAVNEKSEVKGISDVGTEARNDKFDIEGSRDSKHYARDEKSQVAGTCDGVIDVDDVKSELDARSDVELDRKDVKEVLDLVGREDDVSDEKPEVQGTVGVKSEVQGTVGVKSEVVENLDGESDGSNEKLEIQSIPDSKQDVSDEKLEVVGTSSGEDDHNVVNSELTENVDGECDEKSEFGGSFVGELDVGSEKSVVMDDSIAGLDTEEKLEVVEVSIGESHTHDEKSTDAGSVDELYADGAKYEVLETANGENSTRDAESELLETSNDEYDVKLGNESISDAEPSKVEESEGTEVEHSVNGKPDLGDTAIESRVEVMELVGSMSITNESFSNSVASSGSAAQSDEDSNVLSDSVALMPQPTHAATEPISDRKENLGSRDDSVALDSVFSATMENDALSSSIAQPDDDFGVLEAAGPEASNKELAETSVNSDGSMEVLPSSLSLSSAAVSLSHSSEALTGGEDAHFICQNWFGVADGVDQWSLEGITKGLYAQEFMQNCEKLASHSQHAGLTNLKEVLQQSAAMTQSPGAARVLVANFDNQILRVANIGDSGFIIIRNGAVLKKSSPVVHEFHFPCAISCGDDPLEAAEEYHVELEDGDVVVTATDGLFDNLYEQEIASIVSNSTEAGMEPKEIAQLLAIKAQEVGESASARSPFADAAQAAGHVGHIGGKLDHVTVIVFVVQTR